ncbi:hypothetical protein [uncultured Lutibacter sp.]|uniref:tetratricopeptide repeat protein n=1 Tax=uncultured Lutibacter sp. TaxID=437739 RepID=UPI0026241A8C|nr:hypothetical protein [uncultured Lutibacter sp.]
MKGNRLHSIFIVGMVFFSILVSAQKATINEDEQLMFQTHFFEALKQKAINNYSKAIENLEKCYEIDSTNVAVFFEFSKNYLALKKYFEAEIFINKALIKEPNNNYLLSQKVAILKAQRNFIDAIEIQKKLMDANPKYSDGLVVLYLQNSDLEAAKKLISEIKERGLTTLKTKAYQKYLDTRAKVIIHKKLTEVDDYKTTDIDSLKKIYVEKKEFKILKEILSKEVTEEKFKQVYLDSKAALDLFPAQPYLYKINGMALNKLGKYNEAVDVLTIGIDFVIDDMKMEAEFYMQLIISYEGLNKQKDILKYKQKLQELRQRN